MSRFLNYMYILKFEVIYQSYLLSCSYHLCEKSTLNQEIWLENVMHILRDPSFVKLALNKKANRKS